MITVDLDPLEVMFEQVVSAMADPDLSPAWFNFFVDATEEWTNNFISSRAPDGSTWAPLKRRRPTGHDQGRRPLIDTGSMFASVVSDGAGHFETISKSEAEIGSHDPKVEFHQYGTKHIPARPFFGMSAELDTMLENRAADRLAEIIRGLK